MLILKDPLKFQIHTYYLKRNSENHSEVQNPNECLVNAVLLQSTVESETTLISNFEMKEFERIQKNQPALREAQKSKLSIRK